jgi:hypothetical protein
MAKNHLETFAVMTMRMMGRRMRFSGKEYGVGGVGGDRLIGR